MDARGCGYFLFAVWLGFSIIGMPKGEWGAFLVFGCGLLLLISPRLKPDWLVETLSVPYRKLAAFIDDETKVKKRLYEIGIVVGLLAIFFSVFRYREQDVRERRVKQFAQSRNVNHLSTS